MKTMLGSVRARMTLWNVLMVALTLTVFGIILRVSVERILWDAMDRDLRERANPPRVRLGPPPGIGSGEPFGNPDGRHHGDDYRGGQAENPGESGMPGRHGRPDGQDHNPPLDGPEQDRGPGMPGTPNFDGPDGRGPGGKEPQPGRPPNPFGPPSVLTTAGQAMIPGRNSPIFSRTGFEAALTGRPLLSNEVYGGEPVRVFSRPLWEVDRPDHPSGRILGVVQVANRSADTLLAIEGVTRTLLFLLPVALIVSGLGGSWLTETALKPVRRLADAAGRIGATNLAERLPESGGDEFSRLSAVLNGMLGRLETAFQRERRFTADASHELKTPLAIIKVNTSLALEDEDLPEDYRKTLKTVEAAADRANRIVQDLLLLARESAASGEGASPGMTVRREVIPVASLLREAVEAAGPAARRVQIESADGAVSADRHHLTRLLVNLLTNALRHTPTTGIVTLSATTDRQNVRLIVRDTGEGISPEHLPHLTQPFYRVDSARTRESGGSGLGLAICESIARAHGGSLKIESTLGLGTTVTVTLPALADGLLAPLPGAVRAEPVAPRR